MKKEKMTDSFFNHEVRTGRCDFSNIDINAIVWMCNDPLQGTLLLRDTVVREECGLANAHLSGGLDLSNTHIKGHLIMNDLQITGEVFLTNLKVDGGIRTNIPWLAVTFLYFKQGIHIDRNAAEALVP